MVERRKDSTTGDFGNFDDFERFLEDIEFYGSRNTRETRVSLTDIFIGPEGGVIGFINPQNGQIVSTEVIHTYRFMVMPGDVLAREHRAGSTALEGGMEAAGDEQGRSVRPLACGGHVTINNNGEFIAEQYGIVSLDVDTLSVASPLIISDDWMKVYWQLPIQPLPQLDQGMLDFWLKRACIAAEVDSEILELLQAVRSGTHEPGEYLIAAGQPAIHGRDGRIEWSVDVEQSRGAELADGTINFREKRYVVKVNAGQVIARLERATEGTPGRDITGKVVEARAGVNVQLSAGANVKKQRAGSDKVFVSGISGALQYRNDKLSVSHVLILANGLNYQTGNIDFGGDVIIQGPIAPGFTVRAGGDVIVTDSVENGTTIHAQGSVFVGRAIVGKRTVIHAAVTIRAQYVVESTLHAGQDILLGNYSMHAKLRAKGKIRVQRGVGEYAGGIMGGEAWATNGVEAYIAGTVTWKKTEIIVGIPPELIAKLDQLRSAIANKNNHVKQILTYFGLTSLDLKKVRLMIENAEGGARKSMTLRAKYLVDAGKKLQELIAEKNAFMDKIRPSSESAHITIREKAYPNVTVRIANKKLRLDKEVEAVTYRLEKDTLGSDTGLRLRGGE